MQEKYNEMLLRHVTENEEDMPCNQKADDDLNTKMQATDENLLDDLLGSKVEDQYEKLLSADDFEAPVKVVNVADNDYNGMKLIRPPIQDDGQIEAP